MKEVNIIKGMVSCVIPAYNTEKYIYDCLISVKKQSYKDIELIIVDDGSTDKTIEKIKKFCKINGERFKNIEIKHHEKNKGLCASINSALELVKGEYTMWFDSDDLLTEDNIEKKVDYLKKHPDIKCVMAEADSFDENGMREYKLGNRPVVGNQFDSFLFGYCDMSAGLNLVYTNTLLNVLPENGLRTDIKEQNWYMISLLASQIKIGHLKEVLYHYRVRSDSDSHRKPLVNGEQYRIFWDSVDRQRFYAIEDSGLDYIYKCRAFELQSTNSIVDRITTIDDEQIKSQHKYVKQMIELFLKKSEIDIHLNNRKIYLWGSSEKQRQLEKVFKNRIEITGYVNSADENQCTDVISGKKINPQKMYILITLEYHEQIVNFLKTTGFINHKDYYYPKADLYFDIKEHEYIELD